VGSVVQTLPWARAPAKGMLWVVTLERSLQISFHGIPVSPAVEARIRQEAEQLERYFDRIVGCSVKVEVPHRHSHKGQLYEVGIELRVPGGPPLVVGHVHHDEHAHQDVMVAVRDSFAAARRLLQDHARKLRADVKVHDEPDNGRIARIDLAGHHGFIEASDGTEVYFHEHALDDVALDDVAVGDEVRFFVHHGEGVKGPQASTVRRIGKHHLGIAQGPTA
jgi:cold shock CspA family protein